MATGDVRIHLEISLCSKINFKINFKIKISSNVYHHQVLKEITKLLKSGQNDAQLVGPTFSSTCISKKCVNITCIDEECASVE